jgi:hypothetical protein
MDTATRPSASQVESAIASLEIASGAGAIAGWVLDVVLALATVPPPLARVFVLTAGEYADRVTIGIYATRELAEAEIVCQVLGNDQSGDVLSVGRVEIVEVVVETAAQA